MSQVRTSGYLSFGATVAMQETYFLCPANVSFSSNAGGAVLVSLHILTVQSRLPETTQCALLASSIGSRMEETQRTSFEWPDSTQENWYADILGSSGANLMDELSRKLFTGCRVGADGDLPASQRLSL